MTTAAKILNDSQARAVFDAMCALNNVWGRVHVRIDLRDEKKSVLHAVEHDGGEIQLFIGDAIGNRCGGALECYQCQADFAEAYGLI